LKFFCSFTVAKKKWTEAIDNILIPEKPRDPYPIEFASEFSTL